MQHVDFQTPTDPIAVQPLSGAALLAAWEIGTRQSPPGRALSLLHAGCPALHLEDAAKLPLTVRDHALVALRANTFGPMISAAATCDSCGKRLEFAVPAQQIAATLEAADADCALTQDGIVLRLRLANTRDVMDAAAEVDLDSARRLLLARCALATDDCGRIVPVPESLRDAALERLDALHEAAEITLALDCPACDARQAVQFDIASILWTEIRHAAERLLDDVHELAWAYGWSEAAILAMSAARRQAYLKRVRG